ncbi:hypothetical protein ACLB2K_001615 [Fragaria x ananassa]
MRYTTTLSNPLPRRSRSISAAEWFKTYKIGLGPERELKYPSDYSIKGFNVKVSTDFKCHDKVGITICSLNFKSLSRIMGLDEEMVRGRWLDDIIDDDTRSNRFDDTNPLFQHGDDDDEGGDDDDDGDRGDSDGDDSSDGDIIIDDDFEA